MKVNVIDGPHQEERLKSAQQFILKQAIALYEKEVLNPKKGA